MLDVKQATKVFSAGTASEHHALNGLNLHLDDGEFVTIIGSNGAGKSTLFNAICGNYWLDQGQIFLDGQDITFLSEHRRARQIGRVFQDPMKGTAPHLTIEENLALAYTRKDRKPFRSAVRKQEKDLFRTELEKYHMDLENRMKTKVGLLSGGQRQVVTLLMCTLVMPKLLLLDEHTAALDPATGEAYQLYYIVESRQSTIAILTKTEYMQSDSSEIWHTAAEMPQNDSWFFENQREYFWKNMANIVKEIFPTDELLERLFAPQVPDSEEKPENIAQQ